MWQTIDEPLKIFRTAARTTRIFGYAGPSNAKATLEECARVEYYVSGLVGSVKG